MPRLTLSSPKVVAEIIDGEAIILDLRAGSYYATDGVGASVWSAATEGFTTGEIADSAAASYPDSVSARAEVSALLTQLVDAGLLVESDAGASAAEGPIVWPSVYAPPTLERHDDLQDMMQLDPIHDTDVSGWPSPAPPQHQ